MARCVTVRHGGRRTASVHTGQHSLDSVDRWKPPIFPRTATVVASEPPVVPEHCTHNFNVGGPKFRRAKKCLRLAQKRNPGVRNALNGIGGVAAGLVSPIFVAVGVDFLIDGGADFLEFYHPPTGFAFIALGTVSASTATYLFSNIGNKQAFELRANKQFKKVAYKLNKKVAENLNQAIKAANQ
jgi:hypothetical protein